MSRLEPARLAATFWQTRKVSSTPADNPLSGPAAAVFVSYAPADERGMFRLWKSISRVGVAVFLSQACMRTDKELHLHNALSLADDLLILITPTRADPLKRELPPAFVEDRWTWLAIGEALARGVPILGLLEGMSRREVLEDPAIPKLIKEGRLFETEESFLAYLGERMARTRSQSGVLKGLRSRVCFCYGGAHYPSVGEFERRLRQVTLMNDWNEISRAEDFDAVVVVPDDQPAKEWHSELRSFLENTVALQKPVAMLGPPRAGRPRGLPKSLLSAPLIECIGPGEPALPFLQLMWTIVGYQQYPVASGPEDREKPAASKDRPTLFISYSHKDKKYMEDLRLSLKPLERSLGFVAWSDKEIPAGSKWRQEIDRVLASCRVAVMLVTKDFLASDFIHEHELGPLLKRAEERGVQILWVLVRQCSYEETPLNDYQAAHPTDTPLAEMKTVAERDNAWKKICKVIKNKMALKD